MGNWFKTTLLMAALTALIVLIGNLLGGQNGMILAFILANRHEFLHATGSPIR